MIFDIHLSSLSSLFASFRVQITLNRTRIAFDDRNQFLEWEIFVQDDELAVKRKIKAENLFKFQTIQKRGRQIYIGQAKQEETNLNRKNTILVA